ncbi:hypothetical protein BC941DRAFT_409978 [Chlamydoabsidia padenii]|nr:hypothetical protein BC941DRAFT_409978 [Chlamydoabsidia padenii]
MGKGLVGLWGSLLGDLAQQQQSSTDHHNDKNTGWTFTSSSTSHQRTIQPDGTEEVVTTTRRNGRTETVTTIRHPDGTLQEYRNTSDRPTILSMLSPTPNDNIDSTLSGPPRSNNPLSNLLRSIWG